MKTKSTNRIAEHLKSSVPGDGAASMPPIVPQAAAVDAIDQSEKCQVLHRGVSLKLADLERHPLNRRPTPESIDERAASLQADGQLEDVVVRRPGFRFAPGPAGRRGEAAAEYEILSGETRVLAARKLGWTEIRCTVIECDDAAALHRVALHNGQRSDLNPMQRAELIEHLCKPLEEGGGGKSREVAARAVGLNSGAAASNLVRLLRLPKVWQERVASGELPESFARLMAPYAEIPGFMTEAENAWKSKGWHAEAFESRRHLERAVENWVEDSTRPLDKRKFRYDYTYREQLGQSLLGEYPCLLTRDEIEGNRKRLGIVSIAIEGKDVEVATNVKLYDELQIAIIKRKAQEKSAKKAAAAGGTGEDGPRPKTKAELARAKEQRARQLERGVGEWLETVLRREAADAIAKLKPTAKIDPRLLKLIMFFLVERCGCCDVMTLDDKIEELLGPGTRSRFDMLGDALQGDANAKWQKIARELCAWFVGGDSEDPRPAKMDLEELTDIFQEWEGDLAASWARMYSERDPLVEEFLQLHRKDELEALGNEWGVHLAGKEKKIMLQMLLNRTSPLRLPQRLQPAKPRAAKGGRSCSR